MGRLSAARQVEHLAHIAGPRQRVQLALLELGEAEPRPRPEPLRPDLPGQHVGEHGPERALVGQEGAR